MITSMRRIVALKNVIYALKGVVRRIDFKFWLGTNVNIIETECSAKDSH